MDQQRYIVQAGDTLQRISTKCMGSSAKRKLLAEHNPLKDPNKIYLGKTIELPLNVISPFNPETIDKEKKHIVRYGDTLWRIASDYLGNLQRWRGIARLNKLDNPDYIFIGQSRLDCRPH